MILLHVGVNTLKIQNLFSILFHNKELLNQNGWIYPDNLIMKDFQHYELFENIQKKQIKSLIQSISKIKKNKNLILSCGELYKLEIEKIQYFINNLRNIDNEIKIIFFHINKINLKEEEFNKNLLYSNKFNLDSNLKNIDTYINNINYLKNTYSTILYDSNQDLLTLLKNFLNDFINKEIINEFILFKYLKKDFYLNAESIFTLNAISNENKYKNNIFSIKNILFSNQDFSLKSLNKEKNNIIPNKTDIENCYKILDKNKNYINTLKYWNGQQNLSFNIKEKKIMFNNFYNLEKWGIWAKGNKISKITFLIPLLLLTKKGKIIIEINLRGEKEFEHFIKINDKEWKIIKEKVVIFKLSIQELKLRNGLIEIYFKSKNVLSPKEQGKSNDVRILGIGIENINYIYTDDNPKHVYFFKENECLLIKYDNLYKFILQNLNNTIILNYLRYILDFNSLKNNINSYKSYILVNSLMLKNFSNVKILLKKINKECPTDYNEIINIVNKNIYPYNILSPHKYNISLDRKFNKEKIEKLKNLIHHLSHFLEREIFIISGTLLGFIRDQKFIDHDDDIDLAILLKSKDVKSAAQEFKEIENKIISNKKGQKINKDIHLKISNDLEIGIDLFPSWIDNNNFLFIYPHTYGNAKKEDLLPFKKIKILENEFNIPKNYEKILEINYGTNWKKPDPFWHFNWKKANKNFQEFIEIVRSTK